MDSPSDLILPAGQLFTLFFYFALFAAGVVVGLVFAWRKGEKGLVELRDKLVEERSHIQAQLHGAGPALSESLGAVQDRIESQLAAVQEAIGKLRK